MSRSPNFMGDVPPTSDELTSRINNLVHRLRQDSRPRTAAGSGPMPETDHVRYTRLDGDVLEAVHPLYAARDGSAHYPFYDITTILRDLCSQAGCDDEPYIQMAIAAEEIERLRARVAELEGRGG